MLWSRLSSAPIYKGDMSMLFNKRIKFATKDRAVKIPYKNKEDLGYDIYPFFSEKWFELPPFATRLIPTGLISSIPEDYGIILKERGSTGSVGLGLRAGVIDSGYRGEWFVAITNHNDTPVYICKSEYRGDLEKEMQTKEIYNYLVYSYDKAICQAVVVRNYNFDVEIVSVATIQKDKSLRGSGKLGSSGK